MKNPDQRTIIKRAAIALVARAERRAKTLGGKAHEYVTEAEYNALRAAVTGTAVASCRHCTLPVGAGGPHLACEAHAAKEGGSAPR